MRLTRGLFVGSVLIVALATSASTAAAQERLTREYRIKASFLYNVAKFIEWPERAFAGHDSELVVGILGDDPFGAAIDSYEGRTVNGRTVVVRRFESHSDLGYCNVLFISSSEQDNLKEVLASLEGSSVLTVSEMDSFAEAGGIIHIVVRRNRIAFRVNVVTSDRAGLRLSSQLLRLADSLEGKA